MSQSLARPFGGFPLRSCGISATALGVAIAAPALAGPSWDRDLTEDAGQTALSAQIIPTPLSYTITVTGRLLGTGFVVSDYVDMYQVQINSQTLVSISTAGGALGGSADFDTELFLFRRKGGNGANQRAAALKGNDNAAQGNSGSRIGEGLDPSSNAVLLNPGFYYIAISGVGTAALGDAGGLIWPDLGGPGQTISGDERFLDDWTGQGEIGSYTLKLQVVGGGAAPAPGALAILGLGALVGRGRRR